MRWLCDIDYDDGERDIFEFHFALFGYRQFFFSLVTIFNLNMVNLIKMILEILNAMSKTGSTFHFMTYAMLKKIFHAEK